MQNSIELKFADGEYLFALPLARMDELQRKTGVGIGALYARVLKGVGTQADMEGNARLVHVPGHAEFHALDLVETIRQGLIGGNHGIVNGAEIEVSPVLAGKLIDNYVLTQPLMDSWSTAAMILGACIVGFDPPKKAAPASARAPRARKRTKKAR